MIVSVELFSKYTGVFTDDDILQTSYLLSSQNIVTDYLGYNPEYQLLHLITGELEDINDVSEIPVIIQLTIMRIAAILQTEEQSNIGVTSKQFGDSGSRTFVNTVDFSKYLVQIAKYRKIRI